MATFTRSDNSELARKRATAARHPSGFTPPALVMILMPRCNTRGEDVAEVRQEVGRVPCAGLAGMLLLQDGHGDFGQVVHDQVIDRTTFDLPARRVGIVTPEPAAVGDNRPFHLNNSRAITIRCTSEVPSPISHSLASR